MKSTSAQPLNLDYVRKQFPALQNGFIYLDNAGGSLVPQVVADRVSEYLTNYSVQLGASYEVSAKAKDLLTEVTANLATYVNAEKPQEVIVGSSTTMLLRILSLCISKKWRAGDEVIVTNTDHEANLTCWTDLEVRGIIVKTWKANHDTFDLDLDDLQKLITNRTKLVTITHVSNLLGTINPVKQIAKVVHEGGALLCVDGVAFAPHRLIDVQDFEADFYVYSCYKVFGPHVGLMYGKYSLLEEMDGINHYFLKSNDIPYKFQPGNFNYELTYGLQGVNDYLEGVHDKHYGKNTGLQSRHKYEAVFELIAAHEESLAKQLLEYLGTNPKVKLIGVPTADKQKRVPTISFVYKDTKSPEIVKKIDPYKIGIRHGDFYAKRLATDFGLIDHEGVVRVSVAHYNTAEEIDKLIQAFEETLP